MCDLNPHYEEFIVSSEEFFVVKSVLHAGLSFPVVVFGLVTSAINVAVFRRLGLHDSVNISIIGLTLCDILQMSCSFFILLYCPINIFSPAKALTWEQCLFPQVSFLQLISANAAYVVAGFLSVERCLCVSMPLRARTMLSPRTTIIIIAVIVGIVFITLSPMLFIFECTPTYNSFYNTVIHCVNYTDFFYRHGQDYVSVYNILNVIFPLASLACMTSSTVIIARQLFLARSRRAVFSGGHDEWDNIDHKVMKMLMTTIIIYIICVIPRVCHFVAMLVVSEYHYLESQGLIFMTIVHIIYLLDFINPASHFIIFSSWVLTTTKLLRKCFAPVFLIDLPPNLSRRMS